MAAALQYTQDEDVCVYESPAAYYVDSVKKWVYGNLFVSPEGLYFECNEDQKEVAGFSSLSIDFNEISMVQKEASSYIFPSLTVLVGPQKYWFSSFPSRESAYSMIEHFWKQRLFLQPSNGQGPRRESSRRESDDCTLLGRDILEVVYDSQRTLNSSARALHRQGRQLDDSLMTMEQVHGDLAVADRQLSQLESWFGRWSVPPQSQLQSATDSITDWKEYSVVFRRNYPELVAKPKLQAGTMRISKDGITLFNMKRNVVYQFLRAQISSITILSPWEMKIEQRQLGEKDICFFITTAQLLVVLSLLQRQYGNRICFEESMPTKPRKKRPRTAQPLCGEMEVDPPILSNDAVSSQLMLQKEAVSEAEVEELSQMLNDMKSLALGIQEEQEQQMDNINKLMTSVDDASVTIQHDVKRMRRLMS